MCKVNYSWPLNSRFELCGSSYKWIFFFSFNSKYCSISPSTVGWIHTSGTVDMEEPNTWRVYCKFFKANMSKCCSRANCICISSSIPHWPSLMYTHKSLHYIYALIYVVCLYIYTLLSLHIILHIYTYLYALIFICT